jgi:type IV secretion system protein VirD4
MAGWFEKSEREKWASSFALAQPQQYLGIPALDERSRSLYGDALPRGVLAPRLTPDRPPLNYWMRPHELLRYRYLPGQIILGKFAGQFIGQLDDRPQITIAGARAGKTSTILEPNLYLYPGSCIVLDPKGELTARTAALRRALGHDVFVLDPFGQSGVPGSSFNALAELDPDRLTIIDDVASIAQALIVDEGDSRAKHWNDSARMLLQGIVLLTLLISAVRKAPATPGETLDDDFFSGNKLAVNTLLRTMANAGGRFGGILAAIGNRFASTPLTERGSIFSTAAAQTDFLDSLPLRAMSRHSDVRLRSLRSERPTTIYLCLPVGRMESHSRWLRLVVQMACVVLEQMGNYPRDRPPILFMMEEFPVLSHMEIMEKAAAYFPGFGIKLVTVHTPPLAWRFEAGGWRREIRI